VIVGRRGEDEEGNMKERFLISRLGKHLHGTVPGFRAALIIRKGNLLGICYVWFVLAVGTILVCVHYSSRAV